MKKQPDLLMQLIIQLPHTIIAIYVLKIWHRRIQHGYSVLVALISLMQLNSLKIFAIHLYSSMKRKPPYALF